MVKNLSLGDLELILCDWYEMDEQLPNPIFEKKEFERVSNGLWAIGGISKLCIKTDLSRNSNFDKKSERDGLYICKKDGNVCIYEQKE